MIECMSYNLHRADLIVTELYNRYLEPVGITVRQYTILSYINEEQPVNISRLSRLIGVDRTTMVRNIQTLESKEVIAEQEGKGRSRYLALTDQGRELFETAKKEWNKAQEAFGKGLGKERTRMLRSMLDDIEHLSASQESEVGKTEK